MQLLVEPGSEYNMKRMRSGLTAFTWDSTDALDDSKPSDNEMKTSNGHYMKINCLDVCEYMFHVINKQVTWVLKYNFFVAFILSSVIVYLYWKSYSYLFSHSIGAKVIMISAMYLILIYTPALFIFAVSILTDVFRRYQIGCMLQELVSVSDVHLVDTRNYDLFRSSKLRESSVKLHESRQFKSCNTTVMPRIDMSMPANYISWCACRQVMAGFGSRFLFRTNLYLGKVSLLATVWYECIHVRLIYTDFNATCCVFFLVGILVFLAFILVVNTLIEIFFSSLSSSDVCRTFNFAAAAFMFGTVGVLICILMTGVYMTNRSMNKHRVQISTHLFLANKALHELIFSECIIDNESQGMEGRHGDDADSDQGTSTIAVAQLRECIESANAVLQSINEYDEVESLKVMNIHVEKEYIISTASSIIVFGLILYNYCGDRVNSLSS
jgi:hypothetical protein